MGVYSPAAASNINGADLVISGASNTTLALTLATTEYSFTIPAGTKAVVFKARRSNTRLQYAYQVGESGTNYVTVKHGTAHWVTHLKIGTGGLPVYIQSAKAGETLEIIYYS